MINLVIEDNSRMTDGDIVQRAVDWEWDVATANAASLSCQPLNFLCVQSLAVA